jgi:toxin FitB
MFLLDTNVVSETRRKKPHGGVLAWLASISDRQLHLSAVSIGEIQAGIELTREVDEAKALELEMWLEQVSITFRLLPMDGETFCIWAKLMHKKSQDFAEDAMIAATALQHNLTVATRNVVHFRQFKVRTINPFEKPSSLFFIPNDL